jgi:hypothetical protein
MKKHIARILIAASILTASLVVMPIGCTTSGVNDALITAAISAGTSAGLRYAVSDPVKRSAIAAYLNTYAAALRTITGNPTPAQLTDIINAQIPQAIRTQYPEITAFATPLVVSGYESFIAKYGTDTTTVYKYFNDAASGIEEGSAQYLH